jgi:hypothetical protein
MISWTVIVILICIALAAFGLYREYLRANRSYLALRILAILTAIITLAGIALPISYPGSITATPGTHKILLTEGFIQDSLSAEKKDSLYTLDRSIHQQYPKARLVADISQMFTDTDHIAPLAVFGYGLDKEELKQLAGKPAIFHPSPVPDGFIAASWTTQLKTGETFKAQVKYKNTQAKNYKLLLKGLNTTLDSVIIPKNTNSDITLKFTPKNTGRAVYTLLVIDGKDTLQQELLPVSIDAAKPLNIFILSASPDFESKFLKTWLSENGYSVASRSTITKGKFSQEYANMDKPDLTRLSGSLLAKFDVLIGDLSLLNNLSAPENSALQQEVLQKGMGVIIRADSAGKTSWLQRGFPLTYLPGKQATPAMLNIQGKGKTAKLNLDPVYISGQNNTQTLVTDEHDHLIASAALAGAGKLVFTTITNTYNWLLKGNKDDYYTLWSLLINKAARKTSVTESWLAASSDPVANKSVNVILESTAPSDGIKINQAGVAPAQDPAVPFQQVITYWPTTDGWQRAEKNNSPPYYWYTWPKNAWQSLIATNKLNATMQYAREHQTNQYVTKQIRQKSWIAVPKIYFFILFLIATTFLWAESKFLSR